VLAAWGHRDVPPDPRVPVGTRIALLGHVRRWAEKLPPPAAAEFFRSPVAAEFVRDLGRRTSLPVAGGLTDADKEAWEAERTAWAAFWADFRDRHESLLRPRRP
jgi:hypothetical protein